MFVESHKFVNNYLNACDDDKVICDCDEMKTSKKELNQIWVRDVHTTKKINFTVNNVYKLSKHLF